MIEIQDGVLDASITIDEATKQGIRQYSAMLTSAIGNHPKLNAYQFKSLTSHLLIFWNDNISTDIEKFWEALNSSKLPVERKDQIKDALLKKRFNTVEKGIGARNHWEILKQTTQITERFSLEQIN